MGHLALALFPVGVLAQGSEYALELGSLDVLSFGVQGDESGHQATLGGVSQSFREIVHSVLALPSVCTYLYSHLTHDTQHLLL